MEKRNPCRCVGPTLRFEPGSCFTCGRLLASEIGRLETSPRATGESAGLGALLHAVGKTRDKMDEDAAKRAAARAPRPRPKRVRRVVIEAPPPPPEPESKRKRRNAATVKRSKDVRNALAMTRTF